MKIIDQPKKQRMTEAFIPIGLSLIAISLTLPQVFQDHVIGHFISGACIGLGLLFILKVALRKNKKTNKETINQNKQN